MKSKTSKANQKIKLITVFTEVAELLLLTLVYYYVFRNMYPEGTFFTYYGRGKFILMGVYAVIAIVVMQMCEGFKFGFLKTTDLLFAQWISVCVVNFITYFQLSLIANVMIEIKPMLILILIDFLICAAATGLHCIYYQKNVVASNMIMVYGNKESATLKLKMDTRIDKYNISKIMSADEGIEAIEREAVNYDALIIADVQAELRNDILKFCYLNNIVTYATPKISDVVIRGAEDINMFDTPLVLIKTGGLTTFQRFWKRFFDIVLCVIAVVALSPFMLIVAAAIKLEDGGPVFYKQRRCTRDCKEFDILKFRSMIVDAEKDGARPATDNDDRITKVGKVIRAIRMDELPQLFNIIKGDMSIVGPRPERIEHVQKYTEEIPEFVFRSKVKGGLTGYAQIYGKYNTTAYDKLKLDLMYIENYSLVLDIRLILMTIRILFKKESTEGFDKQLTADEVIAEMENENNTLPPQ